MKKVLNICVFIISIACLFISALLFRNMAIFCDEFNTSPDVVCGGSTELLLNWAKLFLLAILSVFSAINIFLKK